MRSKKALRRQREIRAFGRGKSLKGLKTKYRVGQRVKVTFHKINADGSVGKGSLYRKNEINCDVGTVVGIKWRFLHSETHRNAMYKVVFDAPYIKKRKVMYKNINEIWVGESSMSKEIT